MSCKRILLVHNYYQQPGGEDQVFAAEGRMLEHYGHHVIRYTQHNDSVMGMSTHRLAAATIWNRTVQQELAALLERERPDLVHFHNTFLLISPAAYQVVKAYGIPVVQTLHNYRLICPSAVLQRNGRPCHLCVGLPVALPGVWHACYRHSRPQSAVVAAMLAVHHLRHTWQRDVDVFIALSQFARQQFIAGGLPAARVLLKPNFLDTDPGTGEARANYAIYAGRLVEGKGLPTLIQAWSMVLDQMEIELYILGDGPLKPMLQSMIAARGLRHVRLLGHRPHADVIQMVRQARVVMFPSEFYENFPMSLVEAFACGTPVVATRLGSTAEIITQHAAGLLFEPCDAAGCAAQVARLWSDAQLRQRLGEQGRRAYTQYYTREQNYRRLRAIYTLAQQHHAQRTRHMKG